MAGRSTKLDRKLQTKLCSLLAKGATDKTACDSVGIHVSTFYKWIAAGELEESPELIAFFDAVTRARAKAHVAATAAFHGGLKMTKVKEKITKTYTETRLGKDGQPYEYTETTTTEILRAMPPDWRAGEAWLKRRDRENWSEKNTLVIEDWQTEIIALLREGKVTPEEVEAELGNELAQGLFKRIGLPVTTGGEGE